MYENVFKNAARVCAAAGAVAASLIGGFDRAFATLLIFMIADFILGTVSALFFCSSSKTEGGGFRSDECRRGLMRKFGILALVVVASRLDILIGADYIRDACVGCFIANECLSVFENLACMGVPVPAVLKRALEVLNTKSGDKKEGEDDADTGEDGRDE